MITVQNGNGVHERTDVSLAQLAQSAAALTLAIAAMYCVGWFFADNYFHNLGIPHDSLQFSTDYYLRLGAIPVLVMVIAIIISVSRGSNRPDNFNEAFKVNAHWFVFTLVFCSLMYLSGRSLRPVAFFYFGSLTAGFLIIVLSKQSLGFIWGSASVYKRLVILGTIFAFTLLTSALIGANIARLVVQGKGYGGEKRIKIQPKDEKLNVKDKEFILVMFRDDLYYLIDSSNTAEYPSVLVIPKDEIKYAEIYRVPTPLPTVR